MSYKIDGFEIDPESTEGRKLEEIVQREDVTPEEAIRFALRRLGERRTRPDPSYRPPASGRDPEFVIGMFDDVPDFIEIMDAVIKKREERYSRP